MAVRTEMFLSALLLLAGFAAAKKETYVLVQDTPPREEMLALDASATCERAFHRPVLFALIGGPCSVPTLDRRHGDGAAV